MKKESRFSELIRLQQDSRLTVREFCANEGIAASTFYYWKKKLQDSPVKNNFIPLVVKSPQSLLSPRNKNSSHRDFSPIQMAEDHILMELVYPNGTILRVKNDLDLTHLRSLIQLYD
jgi:hypothetical protein